MPPATPKSNPKVIWLITYASGSVDITHEILARYSLRCVECHTTTWRESKYTLIRLARTCRIRASALAKVMAKMRQDLGIKGCAIHGYDTLTSRAGPGTADPSVEEHPGFRRIVERINDGSNEPRSWLQSGVSVTADRRSVLRRHIQAVDSSAMSRPQLLERVTELERIDREHTALKAAHESLMASSAALEHDLMQASARIARLEAETSSLIRQLWNASNV